MIKRADAALYSAKHSWAPTRSKSRPIPPRTKGGTRAWMKRAAKAPDVVLAEQARGVPAELLDMLLEVRIHHAPLRRLVLVVREHAAEDQEESDD